MNFALEARKVADFIQSLDFFIEYKEHRTIAYCHLGALYTNIVLQAGLNYRTVVQPRVSHVITTYPYANTLAGFLEIINKEGLEEVIRWKHKEKLQRMHDLLNFSQKHLINSCADLSNYLTADENRDSFLQIKGFGFKTLDYTLKLLNFDTIAVDRHIYSFVELAGLSVSDYKSTKKIVEFAADLLEVSRSSIDYSIWTYMSSKNNKSKDKQLILDI